MRFLLLLLLLKGTPLVMAYLDINSYLLSNCSYFRQYVYLITVLSVLGCILVLSKTK